MRWIIVSGCGHTGTTLTAKIIGMNNSVHLVDQETAMFKPLAAPTLRTNIERIENMARASGQKIICEKTPTHVFWIDNIRRELIKPRFVLCTRNPYDVIASIAARLNVDSITKKNLEIAYKRYIFDNLALINQIKESDSHVHRYEDFIADPEGSTHQLCSHLGLSFEPSMLKPESSQNAFGGTHPDANNSRQDGKGHNQRRAWQVNQKIFDGRGRWKTLLTDENKAYVDLLLSSNISNWVLERIGYACKA